MTHSYRTAKNRTRERITPPSSGFLRAETEWQFARSLTPKNSCLFRRRSMRLPRRSAPRNDRNEVLCHERAANDRPYGGKISCAANLRSLVAGDCDSGQIARATLTTNHSSPIACCLIAAVGTGYGASGMPRPASGADAWCLMPDASANSGLPCAFCG